MLTLCFQDPTFEKDLKNKARTVKYQFPATIQHNNKNSKINDVLPSMVLIVLDNVDVIGCSAGVLLPGRASLGL